EFPRSASEAVPMLRWKLKKSVPFEVDETLISYMRQAPREDGVDIVTLLARLSGNALTTAIVRDGVLCGYRCTELPASGSALTPQMLLEEIFPMAAYYQDTWGEGIRSVRVAGLGPRLADFIPPLEEEFRCEVRSLLHSAVSGGKI